MVLSSSSSTSRRLDFSYKPEQVGVTPRSPRQGDRQLEGLAGGSERPPAQEGAMLPAMSTEVLEEGAHTNIGLLSSLQPSKTQLPQGPGTAQEPGEETRSEKRQG